MPIRQSYVLPDTATTAGYKSWAQDVGAALTAAGWVQTADANQINWSTYNPTNPIPVNSTQGFEIWRSNDALSSTCPMYLKIFYAVRNNTTAPNNAPFIYLQFGFGSDGNGTLIGPFGPTGVWGNGVGLNGFNGGSAVTVRTEQSISWTVSGGSFAMVLFGHQNFNNTVDAAQMLVVERSCDSSGNYTDEYVTVWFTGYQNTQVQTFGKPVSVGSNGGLIGPYISGTGCFILPDGNGSAAGLGGVGWSPYFPQIGKVGNPMRLIGGFKSANVGDNQIVQANLYGVTQNFLTYRHQYLTAMLPGGRNQQNNSVNFTTIGIRWEL